MNARYWLKFVNTFGFTGLSPVMPGTVGTLASVPFAYLIHAYLPLEAAAGTVFLIIILSIAAAHLYVQTFKQEDPSEVVLDEVCGYLVATLALPVNVTVYALAFVIFRILDIVKPPPIGYIDKRVGGGLGVVLDDVVAGLVTHLILRFAIEGGYLDKIL